MRPPKRRGPSKGKAQVSYSSMVQKGGKGEMVHNISHIEQRDVDVEPGCESVSVGYEVKYWASDQTHGMTVGTTTNVKVNCHQYNMDHANDVAADLAWTYMRFNSERTLQKLNKFLDGDEDA